MNSSSPFDPTAGAGQPTVDIVAVNYNGRRYLERFLESLRALDYPPSRYRVVLVDNASTDGSPALVRERFPEVHVVEAGGNLGFAGGCNLGIRQSRSDYVALVNNDTDAERGWLRTLVETAESDPRIGLVGGKLLFLTPFLELRLDVVGEAAASMPADVPALLLGRASVIGCEYDKLLVMGGLLGSVERPGGSAHVLAPSSRLAVPATRGDAAATLLLDLEATAGRGPLTVAVRVHDVEIARLTVTGVTETFRCEVPPEVAGAAAGDIINNAGTRVDGEGAFGDRGIFEFDRGQFDAVEDVPALCGASMLLRRRMLEEIGGFDTRYFMYFEDVDLSWRARRAGWRVVYTPHSRLRHVHAGTSREGSPLWVFFVTRNRLFFLIKHGGARAAVREVGRFYGRAALAAAAAARRLVRRHQRIPVSVDIDMQVARSLARHLPGLVVSRYRGARADGAGRWTAVTGAAPSS